MTKDLFSQQSEQYSKYRPTYPKNLYSRIYELMKQNKINYHIAWDCATGNGQVAIELAKQFNWVYATDISENQIAKAPKRNNIIYKVEAAEQSSLKENSIDLITIAQAFHWFNHKEFFKVAFRVCKRPAMISIWCYGLLNTDKEIYNLFIDFYENTLGSYWEPERKIVENGYRDINFPFEIKSENFSIDLNWKKTHFIGYLSSWSSLQKYIEQNKEDPLIKFKQKLDKLWEDDEVKKITFPINFIYSIL